MIPSNWNRATRLREDAPRPAVPTRRGCVECGLGADLVYVSTAGAALYVCADGHQSFIDGPGHAVAVVVPPARIA